MKTDSVYIPAEDFQISKTLQLRFQPASLTNSDVMNMLKKYNFYSKAYSWIQDYANEDGNFKNDFQDNADGTVTDKTTGLMWQKEQAPDYGRWQDAQLYIEQLNHERFSGYTDWRLPTIEELASLMTNEPLNDGLYVSPMFSSKMWFWSCDTGGAGTGRQWAGNNYAWAINFNYGSLFCLEVENAQDIRAVRTAIIPPGRKFYQEHVAYLERGDIDGLLRDHYHEDAEMVSFEFILQGHKAIKKYLTEDSPPMTGKILGMSLDYFAESKDVILYKASVKTEKFGTIKADDAFYLQEGKIWRHIALTIPPENTHEWALKQL